MATLEKIRSQQKLLFTIVIIALFLFIISIASADSIRRMFGPGTTIAQVGNKKVEYEDYRQYIDRQNRNQQQQMDHDELSQRAISQLVYDALINEQIEDLGIKVTNTEISRAMTGDMPNPVAQQFIQYACQALGLPVQNGATLLSAIKNPGSYGLTGEQLDYVAQSVFGTYTMAQAWKMQEDAVEESIQREVFQNLISGLFTANELDAKAIYNDNSTVSNLSYVVAPYATIPSEGIEVSDAELKAKYEAYKPLYKITEETRDIDYIVVPIQPSQADRDAAEIEVDRMTESLMTNPGLEGAIASSKFMQDHKTVAVKDIKKDRDLSMIPDSFVGKEKVYKYPRLGDSFRIAKITDVSSRVDSVNVSIFVAQDAQEMDSVKNLLASGTTFKELAAQYENRVNDSIWWPMLNAPESLVAAFENTSVGAIDVYVDSIQGANAVYRINTRKAPREFADVTLFTYVVDPSSTTLSDIKTQLSSFLASNSKGDAFSANADSLYNLRHATITASTPKLGMTPGARGASGFQDTRHAIKWAMNAKKGEVSPIFEDNRDYYIVAAVKEIYDGQYKPYNAPDVKEDLTTLVIADKKGDQLLEKYQGKANDLAGYAQLMGAEVRNDSTVVFSAQRIGTLGAGEYALQGQVASAQPGQVVGPVKGANEVVVFVVNNSEVTGRPYDYAQDGSAFMNTFGIRNFFNLLQGNRKIKNNSLSFENYEK